MGQVRPVRISVLERGVYEVEVEEEDRRRRFTVAIDAQGQVSGFEDQQPVGELVLAVDRSRRGRANVPERPLLRLTQIMALPDDTYELAFETEQVSYLFVCQAHEHGGISYVTSEPPLTQMNPAYDGPEIGDTRPVVSVVLAMHRARHS